MKILVAVLSVLFLAGCASRSDKFTPSQWGQIAQHVGAATADNRE